jgi:hypothetical protein
MSWSSGQLNGELVSLYALYFQLRNHKKVLPVVWVFPTSGVDVRRSCVLLSLQRYFSQNGEKFLASYIFPIDHSNLGSPISDLDFSRPLVDWFDCWQPVSACASTACGVWRCWILHVVRFQCVHIRLSFSARHVLLPVWWQGLLMLKWCSMANEVTLLVLFCRAWTMRLLMLT